MTAPKLCVISGQGSDVTACLLSSILRQFGRCGLCALGRQRRIETLLERLAGECRCRRIVVALPEDAAFFKHHTDTVVILTRGTGEAARELVSRCQQAVIPLDDPDGILAVPERVRRWTYSERRDEADLIAKNLRLLPFRTQFEAVSANAICRLSVPLPDGTGLYPGLAAAAAALTFGIPLDVSAAAIGRAQPVPAGMIALPGLSGDIAAGYFEPLEPDKERIREI